MEIGRNLPSCHHRNWLHRSQRELTFPFSIPPPKHCIYIVYHYWPRTGEPFEPSKASKPSKASISSQKICNWLGNSQWALSRFSPKSSASLAPLLQDLVLLKKHFFFTWSSPKCPCPYENCKLLHLRFNINMITLSDREHCVQFQSIALHSSLLLCVATRTRHRRAPPCIRWIEKLECGDKTICNIYFSVHKD